MAGGSDWQPVEASLVREVLRITFRGEQIYMTLSNGQIVLIPAFLPDERDVWMKTLYTALIDDEYRPVKAAGGRYEYLL